MWRMFESAFVRKCAYLLAAFLFALILGHRAHADTTCSLRYFDVAGVSCGQGPGPDGTSSVGCWAADAASACSAAGVAEGQGTGSADIQGSGAVSGSTCNITYNYVTGPYAGQTASGGALSIREHDYTGSGSACPVTTNCGALTGQVFDMEIPGSSPGAAGASLCGSDGCGYSLGPASTYRQYIVGSMHNSQSATASGASCTTASGPAPAPVSQVDAGAGVTDCDSSGGNVACTVQSASGQYCGTYNGDYVCVSQVPAGSCSSYPSGGVACTVTSAKPTAAGAPDNGTPGTPATPTAILDAPGGATTNYYSPAVVSASSKGASTTGTGTTGTKNGSTVAGSSSSSGGGASSSSGGSCVPSAQTQCGDSYSGGQDCTAPPACSGDAVACGIVNQSWLDRCAQTSAADMAAAVALSSGETPPASTLDVSSQITADGGPISGVAASCPAPPHVTVLGHDVVFNFLQYICEFATRIQGIILVVAFMYAASIWFKGILA